MAINIKRHYDKVTHVLILVLILNWVVALTKIIFGFLCKSAGMTADGFHSFSDGASNILGLVGISIACRPVDDDHPYGHKKFETFYSLGTAFLLGIVSFELLGEGIRRIYNPVIPQINISSFLVMIITLIINFTVMLYERRKGEKLQSDILISDSMHTRADILTSLSVIGAFVGIKMGYPVMDAVVTLVIALFIAFAAYEIVRESSRVLCDTVAIVDVKRIEKIILGINGVKSCHKIRSRGRPDDIKVDLHVQVMPTMHIDEAHKISYSIETEIKKNIPEITDIVVHMEPKEQKAHRRR